MGLYDIMFYYFAIVAVVTALLAVSRYNPVHSVIFLIPCFFHVAGLFVLLGAEFLFAIQILVPAGAIMVLYLFVIFLLNLSGIQQRKILHRQAFQAGIVVVILIFQMILLTVRSIFPEAFQEPMTNTVVGNTEAVGGALYTTFLFPFELASLVLLVAIFGSVVLARRESE
jgi:NADH-quinone oxidoreductase subunit J